MMIHSLCNPYYSDLRKVIGNADIFDAFRLALKHYQFVNTLQVGIVLFSMDCGEHYYSS
jgi:hypothetical protein